MIENRACGNNKAKRETQETERKRIQYLYIMKNDTKCSYLYIKANPTQTQTRNN